MSVPSLLRPVNFYKQLTDDLASKGWIDPPGNLAHSRIYMLIGKSDKVISPQTVELAKALYEKLGVPASQITFHDRDLPGEDTWITKGSGNPCDTDGTPRINDCRYDLAHDELTTIYGRLQPWAAIREGKLVSFDQTEFLPPGRKKAAAYGLLEVGYVYVPKACANTGTAPLCRLQVVLHGCLQSAEVLGDEFIRNIGVNEWADTNRIVVLYPQAHVIAVSELSSQNFLSLLDTNAQGCWNWWGYAGDKQFLTKDGVQVSAIWSMIQRITGHN
jgi:poly(3-hydroxybutyrate) depolymerase